MTTPPQPSPRSNRNRKRPSSGSSAPLVSTVSTSTSPAVSGADMNFLNSLTAAASVPAAAGGPASNMYGNDPAISVPTSQADSYRHQTASQGGVNLYQNNTDGQLSRVSRGNQLMRVPSFGGITPAGPMNMDMIGGPGLMGQPNAFAQQVDAIDGTDQELYSKIDKMKKKRASIPPFVLKLSSFVNDPKTDHLIRWSPSGNSFMVLDEDEFSKTLIPDLFKHNNYASFVRQLNMYGFHKVVGLADGSLKTSEQRSKPPSEYENMYFKRGQPDLMWLIQKPKSKKANGGRGKKAKQEEQDTDKEDGMSDAGGGDGETSGVYLEAPRDGNQGSNHGPSRGVRLDTQALVGQLEAVRNHQAMISAAINRLRKDHQQLYEQSLAFQSLHDRHENSINAILTFLATVYDKSLGGHINGAVNNLFAHQVEQGQGMHRGPAGVPVTTNSNGAIIPTSPSVRQGHPVMRTPQMNRRRPLLLESGPSMSGEMPTSMPPNGQTSGDAHSPIVKTDGSPAQQAYQSFPQGANIQELFTPNTNPASPSDSPQLGENQPGANHLSPGMYSPVFSLPDSPLGAGTPPSNPRLPPASGMPTPSPINVPRSLARTLVTPLRGSAQAIIDHNASLAQKSREISELEDLQAAQNENIDHLMGMMRNYTDTSEMPPPDNSGDDLPHNDVDQYFDFGAPGDGMAYLNDEGQSHVDIDELLRGVGVDSMNDASTRHGQILGTNPSTVVASPTTSSVGSRPREELDEEVEEVQPKRRKVA
ncbi:hypothetical protein EDC01DRAFT_750049 [Geopyxis carbonaria]|nr:hypothetical protein EDC01DRAFT_750049 [Geopyxis carbonaria]